MYGFDDESGLPLEDVALSDNITAAAVPHGAGPANPEIDEVIAAVNASREEKIPFSAAEIKIESAPEECVYVSMDDIGVKHLKDSRKEGSVRDYKYVENSVVDLLAAREVEDVAEWLRSYPNIQIVSRDGSVSYKSAIEQAGMGIEQVSDRFHLLKGLTDAAKKLNGNGWSACCTVRLTRFHPSVRGSLTGSSDMKRWRARNLPVMANR